MSKSKTPVTPGVRMLRKHGVDFTVHLYRYEEKGGTTVSARELGVNEHSVVKTLVMQDERGSPFIILMHGDLQVSTKNMARAMGVKAVSPSSAKDVTKFTGCTVGGTSPFGTRRSLPVYVEETILDLPRIYINGGKRGFLVGIDPAELSRLLEPVPVRVGI